MCLIRHFKRLDTVVCERNLYWRVATVVGGIVILERNHIETREALYRLLHREKRTRADAIVLSTLTDETFKRRRAIVADCLVLPRRAAAGHNHKVKTFKRALDIFLRRDERQLVFRRKVEQSSDRETRVRRILQYSGAEGLCDLRREDLRRRNRLGCKRPQRRKRRIRVGDARDAAFRPQQHFCGGAPREDASAARKKRPRTPGIAGIQSIVGFHDAFTVRHENGI